MDASVKRLQDRRFGQSRIAKLESLAAMEKDHSEKKRYAMDRVIGDGNAF